MTKLERFWKNLLCDCYFVGLYLFLKDTQLNIDNIG